MSSPFSNGSALERPMSTPLPVQVPQAPQPAAQYWDQSYRNLGHDERRLVDEQKQAQLIQRGYELAGFVQRDRRAEGRGFEWQRTRGAQWPEQMPAAAAAAVEQAVSADQAARSAEQGAIMAYRQWEQQNPNAPAEVARVEAYRLIAGPETARRRAAEQLDRVLADAAGLVETIENWRAVEQAAPGRRVAAEKAYQAALNAIDTDLMVNRQAASRLGVRVS